MTFRQAKRFIQAWHSSRTLLELCSKLDMDSRHASNTAAHFRRKGVFLPPMKYHRVYYPKKQLAPQQWNELSRWSEKCQREGEES